jgi:hypothetical protein
VLPQARNFCRVGDSKHLRTGSGSVPVIRSQAENQLVAERVLKSTAAADEV